MAEDMHPGRAIPEGAMAQGAPTKMDVRHGEVSREMTRASLNALSGHGDPGKFGRMFPMLDPFEIGDDPLFELAQAMVDSQPADPAGNNTRIPAGFTYLGQFVDHDITLDLTPLEQQQVDPLATMNFRTPALDLDSVYGQGPALAPYMFQRDLKTGKINARLLIGTTSASADPNGGTVPANQHDLPRSRFGRAIIGDERNDENLAVAQTHLAFIRFHNKIVDHLIATKPGLTGGALFDEARRMATWHYQWIVLFDFVERLTEPGLIRKIKQHGRRFYRFRTRPYIPAEFSAAAYRLGHSMVREAYSYNRIFGFGPGTFAPGTLQLLFAFTGKSGSILGDLAATADPADFPPVGPQEKLPSNWAIDWRRWYNFGAPGVPVNATRKLDPKLVPALTSLPGEVNRFANLAFRNLRRGVILGLPCGQDVARAMGVPILSGADLSTGPDGAVASAHGMHRKTPLWYYILKEAEVMHGGERLGPVGTNIVAEVFLGLVHGDPKSFLWQKQNWKPELPSAEPDHFTMVDLLNFVGDLNPVG
jgi:Animal haem peroxidase